jgi:hypothetical protein
VGCQQSSLTVLAPLKGTYGCADEEYIDDAEAINVSPFPSVYVLAVIAKLYKELAFI